MTRPDGTRPAPELLRTETFACEALRGFAFDYPVYRDWEVRRIESTAEDRCRLLLDWPAIVEFEVAPQVTVHRRRDLIATTPAAIAALHDRLGTAAQTEAAANPNGALSDRVHDPGRWTAGYRPKPDQWDFLQLYGPDFGVRIGVEVWGDDYGFSRATFADEVVRTFRFTSGDRAR